MPLAWVAAQREWQRAQSHESSPLLQPSVQTSSSLVVMLACAPVPAGKQKLHIQYADTYSEMIIAQLVIRESKVTSGAVGTEYDTGV